MLLRDVSNSDIETPPSRADRRVQGIFYSPADIAHAMTSWAVRDATDTVFDPSFGGCAFLRAASGRLRMLGTPNPNRQLYGVDSDGRAWRDAIQLIQDGAEPTQFKAGDFLAMRPSDIGEVFTAVVGNPPYVRRRMIEPRAYAAARSAVGANGYALSAQASYWAYFVLHALQFVAPGGRLAFILPGSLLHAGYARTVRDALRGAFARVTIIVVDGRVFPDALEESLVVLAEERGGREAQVSLGTSAYESMNLSPDALMRSTRLLTQAEMTSSWFRGVVRRRSLEVYDDLASSCTTLGDEARIRLGAVTGANRFFVLTAREVAEWGIEKQCVRPVLTHSAQLQGLSLTREDLDESTRRNARVLMFYPPANDLCPSGARAYIRWGEEQGIHKRYKCAVRRPWYVVGSYAAPDAFLQYMAWSSLRLSLNSAGAGCTNTIHGLTWYRSDPKRAERVACASLSTLTQLSAELEGRSYGGGVLKLEPSEAARLVLPIEGLASVDLFARADELCRAGDREQATALVDDALTGCIITPSDRDDLVDALATLRARRIARAESREREFE